MSSTRAVLDRHVDRFNQGVLTSDFSRMVDQFANDAEMHFEGIQVGPFIGKRAIAEAYVKQPPDDEIVLLNTKGGRKKNAIVAEYAWSKRPKVRAGEIEIETSGGLIAKLTIRYFH